VSGEPVPRAGSPIPMKRNSGPLGQANPASIAQPAKSSRLRTHVALWVLALALVGFLLAWPLLGGMVAANDDLKFLRGAAFQGNLRQDLREGWSHATVWRPLEILAAQMCDAQSLECRAVMLIHGAGLLALLAGLAELRRRVLPQHPIALPMMIVALALSPATSVSLWQMDTSSQTWSAALGIWMGLTCWRAMLALRERRSILPHLLALTILTLLEVNVKETGYGWCAGVGVAIMLAVAARYQDAKAASRSLDTAAPRDLRPLLLLVPVALLPAVLLVYRLKFAALGSALGAADAPGAAASAERYHLSLGANVLNNAWLSLLGLFADGPSHLLTDDAAVMSLRVLPVLSLLASFVIIAAALALAVLHRVVPAAARGRALALAIVAGVLSISVTLPMGSVSELYGLGPNVASGLLIVVSLLGLWHPPGEQERSLCRLIALLGGLALLVIGIEGVASRAYHFRLTWTYAREVNRMLLDHQRALPSLSPGARSSPALIAFPPSCYTGHLYSSYVVAPMLAIGWEETESWMNRRDPQRPVMLAPVAAPVPTTARDLRIDCDRLPRRRHW